MWWCIVSVAASVAGRKEKMLLFKMRFSSYRLFYFLSCISRSILQIMSGLACMYYGLSLDMNRISWMSIWCDLERFGISEHSADSQSVIYHSRASAHLQGIHTVSYRSNGMDLICPIASFNATEAPMSDPNTQEYSLSAIAARGKGCLKWDVIALIILAAD